MALSIGELVGFIRADDSGWRRGLDSARLRMRGLQRDTDGSLRDLRGRFVSQGEAAGRGLADGIRAHAQMAAPAVRKLGTAVAALGLGAPAAAAVGAALGVIAAGALAAGLAVKAFQLAAKPQLEAVTEASAAAEKAEEAHEKATLKKAAAQKLAAKGGDDYKRALREAESAARAAKEADAALERQMKGLPPATQATAKAFAGLKGDYEKWSDSLAGTTMPVFTKGIEILRDLLPTLTPFVKAAAGAIGGFLDDVGRGVKSAGFKKWADDMAAASGTALKNFLTAIKNIAVGFGGLLGAFLPVSGDMTGGLADMTQAFADWGSSLGDSAGFALFMDVAKEGGETFGVLATAALEVLSALSPLIGVTAQLAVWIADLINSMPPDVLLGIATGFTAISLAIKAYALYTTIAAAVTRAWAIAQGAFNIIMMMNPIGLVIAAIVALVAIVIIAYKNSETFRSIVQGVWKAVQKAVEVAVDGIITAVAWFSRLPGMISKWFGQAKDWAIRKFLEMVIWLTGLPGRARAALSGLAGALGRRAAEAGVQLVSSVRNKLSDAVAWIRGLPGRARSALGSLGGVLKAAGRSLIRGFIDGIRDMLGSVRDAAGDVVSAARDFFPFSPAKKGPFSGSGYTLYSGRALVEGFERGINDQLPKLRATMAGLPGMEVPDYAMSGAGMAPGPSAAAAGAGGGVTTVRIVVDGPEPMKRLIRGIVATDYGGDVQAAFGRGKR